MLLHSRWNAPVALVLLVAAASLGIAARFYVPNVWGQSFFVATRFWILALPIVWHLWIDRGNLTLNVPRKREVWAGIVSGIVISAVILGAYGWLGRTWIDPSVVRATAGDIGLLNPIAYLAGATYFTFINALVEEYIWRWFVYRKCEVLLAGKLAVILAAFCFTLHHVIALAALTGNGWVVALGSLGVFLGGVIWSWCFLAYRSLWVCYVSHLLADLAIALIGWHLLFG
ncbi:lysostaphin resistance A-like protein [Vacuolonema iberomarrocanum]|uniref:CPBP family intramembrane glutamic endopeptidase n=1 Tax=Vacuolonema iberomarrocanum TaxID=3454632 RepID=UPI0019ED8283|nr:CPBP family intramembrane metalloprotease [filamentous cyanobacterium LEGE 07170]